MAIEVAYFNGNAIVGGNFTVPNFTEMRIDNTKGWSEAIIDENGSYEQFYKVAGILHATLDITFKNKLSGLDSIYWDFNFKDTALTLHYNNYMGVSIFPKALTNAKGPDNKAVTELAQTLSEYLQKFNDPNNFVSKYFDPEPIQWGLRGDPQLWKDMKHKAKSVNIPTNANEMEKLLHKLFKELTGEAPQKRKNIYVKKYETIGMSKGMVSSDFWLDKGFSLIIQRYIESELQ